jgi:hypothetical protein
MGHNFAQFYLQNFSFNLIACRYRHVSSMPWKRR